LRKVALTLNGTPASSITISYTGYHPNVELYTVEAKAQYERETKRCSSKAHLDSYEIFLDVVDLSRISRDPNTKGSNWFGVRSVNVNIDSAFVTYTAFNHKGERTMSHFIPIRAVEKVDCHYLDPNLKRKHEGKTIDHVNEDELARWR
jgi:hypothetical protein